jgi:hypothetical protein
VPSNFRPYKGEVLPLPVSPTGELGYSGIRGARRVRIQVPCASLPYC